MVDAENARGLAGTPGESGRIEALDALRGVALFGVLQVNLLTDFRVPLLLYLEKFHTHPGAIHHAIDWIIGLFIESKAFALFSLLFGCGMAMQIERTQVGAVFLLRRCGVLLGLGLLHHVLLWNGDILALYGALGLLLIPVLLGPRSVLLPTALLLGAAASLLQLDLIPHGASAQAEIEAALRVFQGGNYREIFSFRLHESRVLIVPLLVMSAPRVASLFLFGAWAFRAGILEESARARSWLWRWVLVALPVGVVATVWQAYAAAAGRSLGGWGSVVNYTAVAGLGSGYGAGLFLALRSPRLRAWRAALAPLGRTALSQYLLQSVVFSLIFYGYGLGLFGRLGAAPVAALGVLFYGGQVWLSGWWLRRFKQGPVEALWRRISYARPRG